MQKHGWQTKIFSGLSAQQNHDEHILLHENTNFFQSSQDERFFVAVTSFASETYACCPFYQDWNKQRFHDNNLVCKKA